MATSTSSTLNPRRALTHPAWLASLALLVLNDHLLKGAGIVPELVTGKLSDFVGLLVAPALLAVLLGVRSRRAWLACHIAVGAVFSAINVSEAAARGFEALTALTPLPWAITVDPTDLVALVMLAVSFRVFARSKAKSEGLEVSTERLLQGAAITAGTLACMGTSPPPCEGDECTPTPATPFESAALTIGNTTGQQRLMRVRPLDAGVLVDCQTLLEDPTRALHRDMFGPAEAWLLEPGRALPLRPQHDSSCEAFLIDAQGLPLTVVAWSDDTFPTRTLTTSVDAATGDDMILMQATTTGGELALAPHRAVFDAPDAQPEDPEPACAVPDETVGIAWSELPLGPDTIVGITSSPDGCHDIELVVSGSLFLCLPLETLPFSPDETIDIDSITQSSFFGADETPSWGSGIRITGETAIVDVLLGPAVLSPSPDTSYDVSLDTQDGCAPHHDACQNYVTPLSVTFAGSGIPPVSAGDTVARSEDESALYIVRAQRMPIRNTSCTTIDVADSELYFESVLVTPIEPEPTP